MIDLRSDTVTKPSKEMLNHMINAEVYDDVFREDPSVLALESRLAKMFNKDAGLFCPSGTMANQIAINVHTQPGDEVICDQTAHIYHYETGGMAKNSGVQAKLVAGENGKITPAQIKANVQLDLDWLAKTGLVSIENTCNKAGGGYYTETEINEIYETCQRLTLPLHVDGARIFNAMLAGNYTADCVGIHCDSISICMSKGLGAPVGTVLLGNTAFIKKAQRLRKMYGGAMRQSGLLAAAADYALTHHVAKLKQDHLHAKQIETALLNLPYVTNVLPVHTNIVIFTIAENKSVLFEKHLKTNHILISTFGPHTYRIVTHFDISTSQVNEVIDLLNTFK